jgi:hypothetical protein
MSKQIAFVILSLLLLFLALRWVTCRLRLLSLVYKLECSGAHVLWDVHIIAEEGGKMDPTESSWKTRVRMLLIGEPRIVMYSVDFIGSETFRSRNLKTISSLRSVERLVVDGLEVQDCDIQFLVDSSRDLQSVALYGTRLDENSITRPTMTKLEVYENR